MLKEKDPRANECFKSTVVKTEIGPIKLERYHNSTVLEVKEFLETSCVNCFISQQGKMEAQGSRVSDMPKVFKTFLAMLILSTGL